MLVTAVKSVVVLVKFKCYQALCARTAYARSDTVYYTYGLTYGYEKFYRTSLWGLDYKTLRIRYVRQMDRSRNKASALYCWSLTH